MIFLGHCKDKVGIVNKITGFFARREINIRHLEQHSERGEFFIRIELETEIQSSFGSEFAEEVGKKIEMTDFNFFADSQKTRVAIFCSKTLHCPLEIIAGQIDGRLNIDIACIISNHDHIGETAQRLHLPFYQTTDETEQRKIVRESGAELMILGRYMRVLSEDFLRKAPTEIINIHHSFLPSFIGGQPYEMAFQRGVKLIGATAHFVTKELDQGPIIHQDVMQVGHQMGIEDMKKAGANIEKQVFAEAVKKFTEHKIIEFAGRTVVFA